VLLLGSWAGNYHFFLVKKKVSKRNNVIKRESRAEDLSSVPQTVPEEMLSCVD